MILAKVAAKVFPDMFAKIFSSETPTGVFHGEGKGGSHENRHELYLLK